MAVSLCGCSSDRSASRTPYQYPLTSPGAKFAALPPTVQNTVRAQAGTAPIHDIRKETHDGQTLYVVEFGEQELLPDLLIASDGSVLNYDLTQAVGAARDLDGVLTGAAAAVPLREVPDAVMRTVHTQAPAAAIASVNREMWGTRTIYIVTFSDSARPKLYIEPDGTLRNLAPER